MANPEASETVEVKEQTSEPLDEYDGPWIEKRIEYKADERSRHQVVLYGSWNGFRKGEDLEYQGKSIYAVTTKLPLGSYVYRFHIDNTDWETNNETAKTVKDGTEYNTITVKEKEESEEEDNTEDKQQNTQVIFDESSQKFVVGKKKRRGRPSMEVDLGKDFNDKDDEAQQEADAVDDTSKDNNALETANTKPEKKKKKKKAKVQNNVDSAQEKEWARMVFVQQLRQQQQHNDEINRVKTLWKQERQVRVEMHKKVVKEKKKLQNI